MQPPSKRVLAGALLGLIPIVLGIVALVTRQWLCNTANCNNGFNLFNNGTGNIVNRTCYEAPRQQAVQGLEIGGVAAIGVGVILSVLLHIVIKNHWIRLIPLVLLILGPTAIIIGLILLLECANGWGLGYSFILMLASGLSGYVLAAYFAFANAFRGHHHHQHQHHRTSSTVIVRESVRF